MVVVVNAAAFDDDNWEDDDDCNAGITKPFSLGNEVDNDDDDVVGFLLLLLSTTVRLPLLFIFKTLVLKVVSHCNHFWICRLWIPYLRAVALWLPLQSPSLRYDSSTWILNCGEKMRRDPILLAIAGGGGVEAMIALLPIITTEAALFMTLLLMIMVALLLGTCTLMFVFANFESISWALIIV